MLEKSASPRHSCTSPACLAPQTMSLPSPCSAQAAPSLPEQTASNYLPRLVPCPMDDKCDSSIKKTRHYSIKTLVQAVLQAKARQSRASQQEEGSGRGGGEVAGGPPVPREPSSPAQKTHHPAPLSDSKV